MRGTGPTVTKKGRAHRYYLHRMVRRFYTVDAYKRTVYIPGMEIAQPEAMKHVYQLIDLGYNIQTGIV